MGFHTPLEPNVLHNRRFSRGDNGTLGRQMGSFVRRKLCGGVVYSRYFCVPEDAAGVGILSIIRGNYA